jgi:polyglutamine-binding protein 1
MSTPGAAADSTATGSLFQQRPLPAPGAVLRKNSEAMGGASAPAAAASGPAIGVAAPPPRPRDGRDGLGEAD